MNLLSNLYEQPRFDRVDILWFASNAANAKRHCKRRKCLLSLPYSESASVMTRKCDHDGVRAVTVSGSESSLVCFKDLEAVTGLKVFHHVRLRPPHEPNKGNPIEDGEPPK